MPESEAPKKRRSKPNHSDQLANAEIDRRLAEAIKERTKLHKVVSRLISSQERLGRVQQEINELVQLQQRLNGVVESSNPMQSMTLLGGMVPPPSGYAGHATDIPPEVGSIPAPRQPKPTTANMGPDVKREGGFS